MKLSEDAQIQEIDRQQRQAHQDRDYARLDQLSAARIERVIALLPSVIGPS